MTLRVREGECISETERKKEEKKAEGRDGKKTSEVKKEKKRTSGTSRPEGKARIHKSWQRIVLEKQETLKEGKKDKG